MTAPPSTDTGTDIPTPHIIVRKENAVYGHENNASQKIVRINTDGPLPADGLLPQSLLGNTPHVEVPKEHRGDEDSDRVRYIPLADAPDWYVKRVMNDLVRARWVTRANRYYQRSDASEMEAIVMAVAEHTTAVGAGQAAVISDVVGWSEEDVHDVLQSLQSTRFDSYRRDAGMPVYESLW